MSFLLELEPNPALLWARLAGLRLGEGKKASATACPSVLLVLLLLRTQKIRILKALLGGLWFHVLVVSSHSSCRLCLPAPRGVWLTSSPPRPEALPTPSPLYGGSPLLFPVIFSISCPINPDSHLHSLYTKPPFFFFFKQGNVTLYCTNSFIISTVNHHFSPSLRAPTPPEFEHISGISVPSWTRLRDWTELNWACNHVSISWLSFIVSHSITWCPEWQLVPQKGLDANHVTWEVCFPQTCFIVRGGERSWCSPEARRVQTGALGQSCSYLCNDWFHCYFQGSKRGF